MSLSVTSTSDINIFGVDKYQFRPDGTSTGVVCIAVACYLVLRDAFQITW